MERYYTFKDCKPLGIKIDRFHNLVKFLREEKPLDWGEKSKGKILLTQEEFDKIKNLISLYGNGNGITQYIKTQRALAKYGVTSANKVPEKRRKARETLYANHWVDGDWDFFDSKERSNNLIKYQEEKGGTYVGKLGAQSRIQSFERKIEEVEKEGKYIWVPHLASKVKISKLLVHPILGSLGYNDFITLEEVGKQHLFCPVEYEQVLSQYIKRKGSLGEVLVRKYLTDHNISFEEQKRFKECKDKKPLPFDFYLTDYNLLIEVDGEGHRLPIKWKGMKCTEEEIKSRFADVILHDTIKNNFCNQNNIPLLRIEWTQKVDELLDALEKGLIRYKVLSI